MRWLRKLYDWVLHWAETPYGVWALFILAFSESSFFPIPPDVLLIALCIARPDRALSYASISTIGSITGGVFGYLIGHFLFKEVGQPIIELYGAMDKYLWIQDKFSTYDFISIFTAALTPIPYKVFTIAAGAFKINFWIFLAASIIGRATRFFIVGGLIRVYGERIREFIDKYFNLCTVVFTILLVVGFIVLKYVFR